MKRLFKYIKEFFKAEERGDLAKHRLYSHMYEDMRM